MAKSKTKKVYKVERRDGNMIVSYSGILSDGKDYSIAAHCRVPLIVREQTEEGDWVMVRKTSAQTEQILWQQVLYNITKRGLTLPDGNRK